MALSELKPCPFCGSENVVLDCTAGSAGENYSYATCQDCEASAHPQAWNTRALLDAARAEQKEGGSSKLKDAYAALRSIAEGNLGDQPWQADYETIKQVARNALAGTPSPPPSPGGEQEAVRLASVAKETFIQTLNNSAPCIRCAGQGHHHGLGEDGNDPDWCGDCGGCGFVGPTDDEAWLAVGRALASPVRGAGEEEAVRVLSTALHNAVHAITLDLSPDHQAAREGMAALAKFDPERPDLSGLALSVGGGK